jgi:hypothetical protein
LNKYRTVGRPVEIRWDLPCASSDGGLLLLRKADKRLGLTSRMSPCLRRSGAGVVHSRSKMLAQRVYGIGQGWEDCNDFGRLKDDPVFGLVLDGKPASQPTLSRFENGVGKRELRRMSLELVRFFIDRHRARPPRRIVIDMDATEDPAHGQQEFEFYHGFYGGHCFLPLLVFCSVDGADEELVGAILRPGNVHAGNRSAALLRRLVRMLKEAFPKVEILFRADAGFALPKVYETCESLGVSYLISLPRNSRLEKMAAPLMAEARSEKEGGAARVRVFGEIQYAASSWSKERRVVVKAEVMDKGENPRFVVTNRIGDPEALYKEYCLRGDCENRIKEMKLDLFSGRTSCHRFLANAFRLLLHAIAFVLMSEVRRLLSGTGLARATLGQIRLKLLKLAAVVQASTRRLLVRLPRGHPHAELIQHLLA